MGPVPGGRRVADKLQTGGGKIALCQLLASRAPGSRTPGSRFLTLWLPRLLLHFTFALHIRPTSIPKPSDRPPSALCHQRCGRRIRRVPYPPLRRFVFHSRGPKKKTKSPGRPALPPTASGARAHVAGGCVCESCISMAYVSRNSYHQRGTASQPGRGRLDPPERRSRKVGPLWDGQPIDFELRSGTLEREKREA